MSSMVCSSNRKSWKKIWTTVLRYVGPLCIETCQSVLVVTLVCMVQCRGRQDLSQAQGKVLQWRRQTWQFNSFTTSQVVCQGLPSSTGCVLHKAAGIPSGVKRCSAGRRGSVLIILHHSSLSLCVLQEPHIRPYSASQNTQWDISVARLRSIATVCLGPTQRKTWV